MCEREALCVCTYDDGDIWPEDEPTGWRVASADDAVAWALANPHEGWVLLERLAAKMAGPWHSSDLPGVELGACVRSFGGDDELWLAEVGPHHKCFYWAAWGNGERLHDIDNPTYLDTIEEARAAADDALRKAGYVLVDGGSDDDRR